MCATLAYSVESSLNRRGAMTAEKTETAELQRGKNATPGPRLNPRRQAFGCETPPQRHEERKSRRERRWAHPWLKSPRLEKNFSDSKYRLLCMRRFELKG